jgi:hypothetical protein
MAEIPLDKLAETLGATLDETARAVKISTFTGIIRDTRVDTGRLRGNWQTSTGRPADGEIERKDKVPQGTDGGAAQEEVMQTVKGDTVDYITNNLPYAEVFEERDGMISRNVARIDRNIREAIKGNR